MKTTAATSRVADRLRAERRSTFVGRERELARLFGTFDDASATVTFVLGLGGIGKTSLLAAFGERLDDRSIPWFRIDGESAPPTPAGFLGALGEIMGRSLPSVAAVAQAFTAAGPRVVLALDEYERFRLLDGWLRQELVPALPSEARIFFFARDAAVDAWTSAPGWVGLVQTLRLGPIDAPSAEILLERHGVAPRARGPLLSLAKGHPLALKLAAGALDERPDLAWSDIASDHLFEGLAPMFLREVQGEPTRRLLEAACLIRRATRSVLAAMLSEAFDESAFEILQRLPFVEVLRDGLAVHETVRSAIAAALRALDPSRYQALRSRAWACLRTELRHAGKAQLWRYTADMLYLVDRAEVREAFFPGTGQAFGIDTARPDDGSVILEMVRAHDPGDVENMARWWEVLPRSFRVVRDGDGRASAFCLLALARDVPPALVDRDPLVRKWFAHLRETSVPPDRPVLFSRRVLVGTSGEGPSPLRSACWLDAKRAYFEYPDTFRIYVATSCPKAMLGVLASLGFEAPIPLRVEEGGALSTLTLDFGADGVLGWLARLVDAQFEAPPCAIDTQARALLVDGRRVPLTRLEFGVIQYLHHRRDRVVTRDELLHDVWEQSFGGSNVVDAVVKSLRKKLGAYENAIETVTGHGYRFCGFDGTSLDRRGRGLIPSG